MRSLKRSPLLALALALVARPNAMDAMLPKSQPHVALTLRARAAWPYGG
ncbi:hypothetical protein I553_8146 [Mycobacterium xenopi 4042]|uniref:Uncharacterized protein n=1 Tax=Mycobacterium xenopi 4042 TaxID=1299334 RepID=X8DDS5_MYCXE|nr:hypothetical protein I553_8146 [Mycobacterium xenopi 4042]